MRIAPAARTRPGRPRTLAPSRRRRRPRAGVVAALGIALLTAGCGAADFDRHWEAGRFARAVEAFRADSSDLAASESAIFRAGVARLLTAGGPRGEREARALFVRLLQRFPGTEHGPRARAFLGDIERREEVRRELQRARREAAALRGRLVRYRERLEEAEGREDSLSSRLSTMAGRLREQEESCARLRKELERLKSIDLESEP